MHRKAIEQLANRIEQKLRNSEDYFTNIQRFFAEKAEQYVRHF
jgi:HPt (histidine-containing phosphotransfer) domain-containing protein